MSKKKIFWLHSHTLMSTGGTRFIHEVSRELSKKYQVELFVERTSQEWRSNFESNNVVVTEISNITSTSLLYWIFFPYFLIKNFFTLKNNIKSSDVVITTMFPFNFIASLLTKNHIYYCFEPFAFFYDSDLMKENGNIKYSLLLILKSIYSWIDKIGTKKSKLLLAINPSVGAYIANIYSRTPDAYSYLGVDTKHFKQTNTSKNKKVTFFHSTDYTPLKGTNYLITALGYLSEEKNNFVVQISESIVNSEEKKKISGYLEKNGMLNCVEFLGHLPYGDLPKYYSKADAYLFLGNPGSTGATAASLSVVEAESCGLPVIRSIGNKDEIVENKTGRYVDPRDPKELAQAMKYVIQNRNKYSKMASECKKHVRSRYTWQNVAKVFIQSIESLR